MLSDPDTPPANTSVSWGGLWSGLPLGPLARRHVGVSALQATSTSRLRPSRFRMNLFGPHSILLHPPFSLHRGFDCWHICLGHYLSQPPVWSFLKLLGYSWPSLWAAAERVLSLRTAREERLLAYTCHLMPVSSAGPRAVPLSQKPRSNFVNIFL